MSILKIRQLIIGVEDSLADLRVAIDDVYSAPKIREMVEQRLREGKSLRGLERDLGVSRRTLKRLVDNFPDNETGSQ